MKINHNKNQKSKQIY